MTVDTTPPEVTITSDASSLTSADTITLTATFTETVTGLEAADFAASEGTVSGVTGSGAVYYATLTMPASVAAADGTTITVDLPAGEILVVEFRR